MPAGNDATAALAELADQFGDGVGHAEDLIQASRARYDGFLAEAQLAAVDPADEKPDFAKVAKTADLDEEQILDAVTAGRFVRYVAVDPNGRSFKGAFLADDLGKTPKTAEKNVEKEQEADADVKAGAQAGKGK